MPTSRKKVAPTSLIIPLSVLGTAVYLIYICWQGLGHDYVEHGWKTAPAIILDQGLKLPGKKNMERLTVGIEQTINYEYAIADRKYQSNSVSKELTVNKDEYPTGKVVEIYYNPRSESDSVLVRTPVQKQYLFSMIGLCSAVAGFIVFSLIRIFKNTN